LYRDLIDHERAHFWRRVEATAAMELVRSIKEEARDEISHVDTIAILRYTYLLSSIWGLSKMFMAWTSHQYIAHSTSRKEVNCLAY